MSIDLGKIKFTWQGVYNALTTYEKNDVVSNQGSTYIAIQSVTGVEPITDTSFTYWNIVNTGSTVANTLITNIINSTFSNDVDLSRRVTSLAKGSSGRHGDFWRCYLMANSTITTTGTSSSNQNGDNTTRIQPNTIVSTTPLASGVTFTAVYQGAMEGYALDSTGAVWAWGLNNYGQLGLGDTTNRMVMTKITFPVGVVISRVIPSGGSFYSVATNRYCLFLTTTGAIYGCGYNGTGQLGLGNTTNQSTPQLALGSGTTFVVDINNPNSVSTSANTGSTMAITASGELYVWGYNGEGQLGRGNYTSPISTPAANTLQAIAIAAGSPLNVAVTKTINFWDWNTANTANGGFSVALLSDGTVWSVGFNTYGQLGVNNTSQSNVWQQVIQGVFGIVFTDIVGGDGYYGTVAAVTDTGNLYVWGYNAYGQLGNGNGSQAIIPFQPTLGAAATFQGFVTSVKVTASQNYGTVYVYSQSQNMIYVAGYNGTGQLANGTTTSTTSLASPYFQPVMGINGTIADYETYGVTNTDYGLSVLYTDGRVAACGHNSGTGECGTKSNTTNDQWTLVDILF